LSLTEAVEEVRGGIRLGQDSVVEVEIDMRTADDAMAVATLGRWVPGFVQLQYPDSNEGRLAELIESLHVVSKGNTVSVSFALNEKKLSDLIETLKHDTSYSWN